MKKKKHSALVKPVLLSSVAGYFNMPSLCNRSHYYMLPELVPAIGEKFNAGKSKSNVKDAVKEFSMSAEEKEQFLSMSLCKLLSLYDVEREELFYRNVAKFDAAFGKDISSYFWNRAVALAFCTVMFCNKMHVRRFLKLSRQESWLVLPGKAESVEFLAMYVYSQFISNLQTETDLAKRSLKSFRQTASVLEVEEKAFTTMFEGIADYYEKDHRHPVAKVIRTFVASFPK